MLQTALTIDVLPAVSLPASRQVVAYYPQSYDSGTHVVMYWYRVWRSGEWVRGSDFHRGRRTGDVVKFSRRSDAERLVRVLNSQLNSL